MQLCTIGCQTFADAPVQQPCRRVVIVVLLAAALVVVAVEAGILAVVGGVVVVKPVVAVPLSRRRAWMWMPMSKRGNA